MKLSKRCESVSDSITLMLNQVAISLSEEGQNIYNLTAGQLPFKPMPSFIEKIKNQLNFSKSYQYSAVAGMTELRLKLLKHTSKKRDIDFTFEELGFDCIISNGTKHTLFNVLATIIDPKDEVILLAP
ncbi:MAG: aspartate aminotransferase, partial [Thermoproteota archaeon]